MARYIHQFNQVASFADRAKATRDASPDLILIPALISLPTGAANAGHDRLKGDKHSSWELNFIEFTVQVLMPVT